MSISKSLKSLIRGNAKKRYHARMTSGRVFSNFGEQAIIRKYLSELAITERTAVDIGAGDGIRRSNTYSLALDGWKTLGVEYDPRSFARLSHAYRYYPNAFACRFKVTPKNVASLLQAYDVEREFGVLSLDIDSYDYFVLDALLASYRPRLVVTEINEKIPPPIRFVAEFDPDFEMRNHFFGYSITALADILKKHDYALLELEYNNAFIAPAEHAGGRATTVSEAYRTGYADRADRREKFKPNENMEILQTMSPEEGMKFLDDFYSEFAGKYQIGIEGID